MRLSRLGLLVVCLSPLLLGAGDFACAVDPPADSIVVSSPVRIAGVLTDDQFRRVDGEVQLQVNGVALPVVRTTNGDWVYPSVALPLGVSTFMGTTRRATPQVNGTLNPFMLQRRTDLIPRGRQDLVFGFRTGDPPLGQILREMAVATLEPDPTPAQLDALERAVLAGSIDYLKAAFAGTNVSFEPTTFESAHIMLINTSSGTSDDALVAVDFNNATKMDNSSLNIPPLRDLVLNAVRQNRFFTETPARPSDTLAQRTRQFSILIGSEAAHLLGHAMGLVAEGPTRLNGCAMNHGCPTFDMTNPLADRFGDGHFIMDPPALRPLFARLGFASPTDATEFPPTFSNYDRSYLRIVTSTQ